MLVIEITKIQHFRIHCLYIEKHNILRKHFEVKLQRKHSFRFVAKLSSALLAMELPQMFVLKFFSVGSKITTSLHLSCHSFASIF